MLGVPTTSLASSLNPSVFGQAVTLAATVSGAGPAPTGTVQFVFDGANLGALTELFSQVWREPFMVQAFLPDVSSGDKRIVLVDGEVAGAVNRLPGEGEIRSNLAVGGSAAKTELTAREPPGSLFYFRQFTSHFR